MQPDDMLEETTVPADDFNSVVEKEEFEAEKEASVSEPEGLVGEHGDMGFSDEENEGALWKRAVGDTDEEDMRDLGMHIEGADVSSTDVSDDLAALDDVAE